MEIEMRWARGDADVGFMYVQININRFEIIQHIS